MRRKSLIGLENSVFKLTDEELLFRSFIRELAQKQIKPIVAEVRDETYFPANADSPLRRTFRQAVKIMARTGFTALGLPEEYGGFPCTSKMHAIFTQELCRVDGAIGLSIGATLSLAAYPISVFGTEEQKKLWLPGIAAGETLGCYAQTEREAGSDVKNIRTAATRDKDGVWRIRGEKIFITNGSESNLAIVIARTSADPYGGLSAFIVDLASQKKEGLAAVLRNERKAGLHLSPTSHLMFDGAAAEVLGGEAMLNRGWEIAMFTLTSSRAVAIPSQGTGIAVGAYELISDYAASRMVFETPVANFPVNRETLIKMDVMITMAELLTFRACFMKDAFALPELSPMWQDQASLAKRFAGEIAEKIPSQAIQLAGGIGYMTDFGLAKFWQDGRIVRIYEGTDHIQELIISEAMGKRTQIAMPRGKLGQWWRAKSLPWTASLPEEEDLLLKFTASGQHSRHFSDLIKLRREFSTHMFAAARRHLPGREERKHNIMHPVWHKLAWALCVLEGAKLLLWQQAFTGDFNKDKSWAAMDLAEEALSAAQRAIKHPR